MRRKEVKLNVNKKGTSTVLATSCWHFGNPSVSQEGIHNFLKKAKKHQWIHHGDVIEGITRGDRRFNQDEHKQTIADAIFTASESLKTANKTCIGLIKGNHEATPSNDFGDISEFIARSAGIPYLGAIAYIKYKTKGGESTALYAHGNGGSNPRTGDPERKYLNRQIWLRNLLAQFEADIKGIGHTHRSIVTPPCYEERLSFGDLDNVKREPVLAKPAWHYAAPSMFTTYDLHADTSNYAEMALYGATDIGWIEKVFDSDGQIACIREVYSTGKTKQEHYPRIVG